MALFKKIRSWWRGLFRKRRFNMLNATDNSEEWHIHLSPASIFAALVAFLLVPHLGFPGACLANPAAWLAADCFLIPCYFAVMRKIRSRVQEVPDIPLPI